MKKKEFFAEIQLVLRTYFIFFILCAFVVTASFLMFFHAIQLPEEQIRAAAPMTLINVLAITAIFVTIDTVRRKITVGRPVKKIKHALRQITNGDFSVRLPTQESSSIFTEIMESINTMTAELSGVETLRTDFIANVSHEMKTPLAVIANYGALLQDKNLPEEKRIEYAKAVSNTAKRLADLMTNILKLNRLENQQIYPQAKAYDVSEQLCECLLQFEPVWEEKGIEIDTAIPENVIVYADADLLSIVWSNLFSNAFKFTKSGGKLRVSLSADAQFAAVSVADTGCGMTGDVGAHIFEKFYQGDPSHAAQGNGLGLALVKRIMDITGGTISVNSSAGIGSTFTIRIRRKPDGAL